MPAHRTEQVFSNHHLNHEGRFTSADAVRWCGGGKQVSAGLKWQGWRRDPSAGRQPGRTRPVATAQRPPD